MAQPPPNSASATQKSVIDNYEPNISPRFGHVEDFWKRYDELADRSDREMVSNLNGNLDVLLIFAGLFSAVNTAFISTAMPSLSPDPSDRTNALLERLVLRFENASVTPAETSPPFSPSRGCITANCFLYASLCCSLIAAVGAMLAKEWLQSYSRSGQAGPLEEQVRFRQKKYTAAQEGHLESVILFLPNLLLLSVLLFFTGLVLLLFPINSTVAAVVIAFSGVGMALSGVTIVAGAISPLSPFQTAISRALRRTLGLPFSCWRGLKRLLKRLAAVPKFRHGIRWIGARLRRRKEELQEFLGLTDASMLGDEDEPTRPSLHVALSEDGHRTVRRVRDRVLQHPVLARASGFIKKWVITPIGTHAQPVIRIFKPSTPDNTESVEAKDRDQHIVNAQGANWLLEMTSSLEDQLTVAQNICLIDPTSCDIPALHPELWKRLLSLTAEAIRAYQNQVTASNRSVAEQFGTALYHLLLCYPRNHKLWSQLKQELPVDLFQSRGRSLLIELSYALLGIGSGSYFLPPSRQSYSFRKMMLHNIVVDLQDRWSDEGLRALNGPYDDAILSLLGLQISLRIGKNAASVDIRIGQNLQGLAAQAYLGANLDRNLADALPALTHFIISTPGRPQVTGAASICSAFLARIKLLLLKEGLSQQLRESLASSLTELLSGFGTFTRHEPAFVRLSMVALSTFRGLGQVIFRDRNDAPTIKTMYHALQYSVISADRNSRVADLIALEDYLLESLDWIAVVPIPGPHQERGLGNYPQLIASISRGLKASSDSKKYRWMTLIHRNLTQLIHGRNSSVWRDAGIATYAVCHLRKGTAHHVLDQQIQIIRHLISISGDWSVDLLAAEVVEAVAEAAETINGWFSWPHDLRRDLHTVLLDLILRVWRAHISTQNSPSHGANRWSMDATLHALRIIMPSVKTPQVGPRSFVMGSVTLQLEVLSSLVDFLRRARPETAFLARNLDVSINRLYDDTDKQFRWNYFLYADHRSSLPCSRSVHINNGLL